MTMDARFAARCATRASSPRVDWANIDFFCKYSLMLMLLVGGWGSALADCLVEQDHTMAAAYARCGAAEKSFLVSPRTWTNNQCAMVANAVSAISCTYYGDSVPGQHSCSGCFGWDSPTPPVDKAKNCCSAADNGSNPITTGLGFKIETQMDLAPSSQGFLGFTRYYTSYDYSDNGWGGIFT